MSLSSDMNEGKKPTKPRRKAETTPEATANAKGTTRRKTVAGEPAAPAKAAAPPKATRKPAAGAAKRTAKAEATGNQQPMVTPTPQPQVNTGEGLITSHSPAQAPITMEQLNVSEDEWRRMIAEAAYYRAERRGFAPEGSESDWLEAEAEVRSNLAGKGR